ncbi:MAG: hypothetical protein JW967_08430 [Dehalococcoidales bacterium]|nr:hypothetical protein [Dehalococcoidales bacterium]
MEQKRVPGGQPGNQNARRHGFYSDLLDETQQADFLQALQVEGLDIEIALLRVKLKSVIRNDPDNIKLITRAAESLAKLVKVKYSGGKNDPKKTKEAIGNVLRDFIIPLGIDISKIISR